MTASAFDAGTTIVEVRNENMSANCHATGDGDRRGRRGFRLCELLPRHNSRHHRLRGTRNPLEQRMVRLQPDVDRDLP